ncbi:MAG TPA: GtrA family protein [Spirochaetota bacterium]|nr:GtrA family protein [Spirochaetota bacterium]HOS31665.1 GtrA family protein [Spirochaetota bacterium]HOS56070.1 GtrA family protein [Spirochaetota bacterium]HPK61216.1 GtrA family protein [Spirochaetota bacterium]HQF77225.1 GtrA family protein [Spirochaetota bacterium]
MKLLTNFLSYIKSKISMLFILYVALAGVATIVDFTVLFIMTSVFNIWYLLSATISYFCGMLTNFTLNKIFNFKNKSKLVFRQFLLFSIVALIGLGLNNLILYLLVDVVKTHINIAPQYDEIWLFFAKCVSVFIVMFWSFLGHKKLTFNLLK